MKDCLEFLMQDIFCEFFYYHYYLNHYMILFVTKKWRTSEWYLRDIESIFYVLCDAVNLYLLVHVNRLIQNQYISNIYSVLMLVPLYYNIRVEWHLFHANLRCTDGKSITPHHTKNEKSGEVLHTYSLKVS